MPRLVTGLFYERSEAERAVKELQAQGVPSEDIYLETEVPPTQEIGRKGGEVSRLEQERRFAGLETGLIIGVTVGLLAGLGIGIMGSAMSELMRTFSDAPNTALPVVPGNVWITALAGAVLGLLAGGLIGWMVDFTLNRLGAGPPMPAQEALVTVRTDEANLDRVYRTMYRQRARHLHVAERSTA
jgi:hypothetical protein